MPNCADLVQLCTGECQEIPDKRVLLKEKDLDKLQVFWLVLALVYASMICKTVSKTT